MIGNLPASPAVSVLFMASGTLQSMPFVPGTLLASSTGGSDPGLGFVLLLLLSGTVTCVVATRTQLLTRTAESRISLLTKFWGYPPDRTVEEYVFLLRLLFGGFTAVFWVLALLLGAIHLAS